MLLSTVWNLKRPARLRRARRRTAQNRKQCRPVGPVVQSLEQRTYLTVSSLFADGELSIVIDEGNDNVAVGINPASLGRVQVLVNGVPDTQLPPVLARDIAALTIIGSDSENLIDLSAVTPGSFTFQDSSTSPPTPIQITVEAENGDDTIIAPAGLDATLNGGNGDDIIQQSTGIGNFTIIAGDGADTVAGGTGNDTIHAGDGDDIVSGGGGDDSILAGNGQDLIAGNDGNDFINGGDGTDTLDGGLGDDTIRGEDGPDSITGSDGNDSLHGGLDSDTIDAGFGNDEIDGAAHADTLIGFFGRDTIRGGSGPDFIDAGGGQDVVNGQHGEDTIIGGPNEDTLLGGGRNDSIMGDAENDVINGQAGDDTIDGGEGFDLIDGASGNDMTAGGGSPDPVNNRLFINDIALREAGELLPNPAIGTFVDADFITPGDLTGDGVVDLVLVENTPAQGTNVQVLIGNGAGGFIFGSTASTDLPQPDPTMPDPDFDGFGSRNAVIGDLDGDGNADVFVPNAGSNNGTILLNTGGGVLMQPMMQTDVGGMGPVAADIGDIDNDGDLDVVVANSVSGDASALVNDGMGALAAMAVMLPGASSQGVALLDADGDGFLDLAVSQAGSVVLVMNGDGMMRGFNGDIGVTAIPAGIPGRLIAADFDGDGDTDLGVGDLNGGNYHILLNTPTPALPAPDPTMGGPIPQASTFAVSAITNIDGSPAGGVDAATGDFDADGNLDIIMVGGGDDTVDLYLGDGMGGFIDGASQPGDPLGVGFTPSATDIVALQLDGDPNALPDVISATGSSGIRTFTNDALGQIDPDATLEATFTVTLLPGDMIEDVSVDLAVTPGSITPGMDVDLSMIPPSPLTFTAAEIMAGNLQRQIVIPVTPDLTTETTEALTLTLSNAINAEIIDATGTAVATRDATLTVVETLGELDPSLVNPLALLTPLDVTADPEGDDDRFTVTFTVMVEDLNPTQPVTVDFETRDGIAVAGADYLETSGSLTFSGAPMQTQTFDVTIISELTPELDEFFFVDFSNVTGGAVLTLPRAVGVIVDDDGPISTLRSDTLIGTTGRDTLEGSRHADVLSGSGGNDVVNGNRGDDTIFGGAGNDTINGGEGNDVLFGQGGRDTLSGGFGDDTIVFRGLGDGQDTYSSEPGFDTILARGDSGPDDFVISQDSNDLLVSEGTASIRIVGSELEFAAGGEVVQVDGNQGNDRITIQDIDDVGFFVLNIDGGTGQDTISGSGAAIGSVVVTIDGGDGDDMITGTGGSETLLGSAGDDTLFGRSGNDSLIGGDGDDSLIGQAGDDSLDGGFGNDTLLGDSGDDILNGEFGNDVADGGDGNDTLTGGFGDDLLNGSDGDDSALGMVGEDTLLGGLGADTLDGGREADTIRGHAGNDVIRGDHGPDRIIAGAGDDTVSGGDGDDFIDVGNGNDGVDGGDGNDTINGMAGRDTLFGGDGDDVITGGNGSDVISGHDGDDTITGNNKRDTLAGNLGDDVYGTPGTDMIADLIDDAFVLNAAQLANLDASTL